MTMEETNYKRKPLVSEEEITRLIEKLAINWKIIIRWSIIFLLIGILIAFTGKKRYTSSVSMAPESGDASSMGSIGSLAAMAGINLNGLSGGTDAIYPLLYPDIIESLPFITSLFDVRVQTIDGCIDTTYLYYRKNIHKEFWLGKVLGFPKKQLKKIIKKISGGDQWNGDASLFDPYYLSESQLLFIESVQEDFSVSIDKKTNVIYLSFTEQDPKVAAIMVDEVRKKLQQAITEYRTQKVLLDFNYTESLYNEYKESYMKAQMDYAEYCDRNRNITQEKALVEKSRLEADMELKNTLYSQWAQQLELSRAKVQQYTPAFTILTPAAIPARPSSPRKLKVLFLFFMLGTIAGCSYVLLKDNVIEKTKKLSALIK